ncbi:MAG: hypothetical protein B6D58_09485 [candidate division Zixibacteria bacterium 4484_95]|nr:MAG: hypothetical protein B6D58_09485 [candidate division Zixibacteria bacterium 4484_95]
MTYQVKGCVDLWLLAAWFYGNPHLWDVIYYENIDAIGDDPENLMPGMTLNIPKIESATESYAVPTPEVA